MALEMTDSVKNIGGGSFTAAAPCADSICLWNQGEPSCIRDVVSETFHEVYVSIRFRNSSKGAELIFPEYYEEGVENTRPGSWKLIIMAADTNTASAFWKRRWITRDMTGCFIWQRSMKSRRSFSQWLWEGCSGLGPWQPGRGRVSGICERTCAGMRFLLYGTGRLEPGFFLSGTAKAVDRGSYGSGDPGSFRQRKSRDSRLSHGRETEIVCKTKEDF